MRLRPAKVRGRGEKVRGAAARASQGLGIIATNNKSRGRGGTGADGRTYSFDQILDGETQFREYCRVNGLRRERDEENPFPVCATFRDLSGDLEAAQAQAELRRLERVDQKHIFVGQLMGRQCQGDASSGQRSRSQDVERIGSRQLVCIAGGRGLRVWCGEVPPSTEGGCSGITGDRIDQDEARSCRMMPSSWSPSPERSPASLTAAGLDAVGLRRDLNWHGKACCWLACWFPAAAGERTTGSKGRTTDGRCL